MNINKLVSVVIPTYNRAHILEKTIPSYLQPEVSELIIINDNSSDNTKEILSKIQKTDSRIHIINNQKNIKQTGCKNIGIDFAKNDFIYFGDDDSYITDGSIKNLLQVIFEKKCDIASARALYLKENQSEDELYESYNKFAYVTSDLVDMKKFRINFTLLTKYPIEVPFSQACFLVSRNLANQVKFSQLYIGNCFREETDFLIRCTRQGAKNFYTSSACQINLPRSLATGGAHQAGTLMNITYSRLNDCIFIVKNFKTISLLAGGYIYPMLLIFSPFYVAFKKIIAFMLNIKEKRNYS